MAQKPTHYAVTKTNGFRNRRVIRPLTSAPPPPPAADADDVVEEEYADCPSDGCSIENAAADAEHGAKPRGYQADAQSSDEAHEKQKNQLDGLSWRGMATPAVKRKRRVLKPLKKEPAVDETASWETVSVDEGNCPSDGCSFEAALPFDENKYARGYQATKHSSEDARARLAIQVETLRAQREADLQAKAAVLAEIERAREAGMSAEEKAAAKAQKDAFYFSVAGLASLAALQPCAPADAAITTAAGIDPFFNFNPVCPASDGVFRVGQKAALSLAGDQNIENYRPLINDVLIRVRTELCILESFSRETMVPFIKEKGVGWVLPLHETSETYLAGVVFMVGANFILLGSTKVVAILAIYHDLSAGLLARAAGGLLGMATPEADAEKREREFSELMDRQTTEIKALMLDGALSREERERKTAEVNKRYGELMENAKETLDVSAAADETSALGKARLIAGTVSVPLRVYGRASGALRRGLEVFDTFCSRYFVAFTVTYVLVKTGHYVLFPNLFD
jgi:hypothetical protein